MKSVPAIYQNGVFRPLEKVDLPEAARVEVLLPLQIPSDMQPELAAVYEVLSRRHRLGSLTSLPDTTSINRERGPSGYCRPACNLERRRSMASRGWRGIRTSDRGTSGSPDHNIRPGRV